MVETDSTSNIAVVEAVDFEVFRQQVLGGLRSIAVAKKGLEKRALTPFICFYLQF